MRLRRPRAAESEAEERRHQEALELDRKALRSQERGLRLTEKSNRIQIAGVILAVVAIVVAVVIAWQPWSGAAQPEAHAAVWLTSARNAIIPKDIGQISTPPSYPSGESGDHCAAWWKSWFQRQGAAAIDDRTIEVSAPQSADVTVTSASVRVYRDYRPAGLSFIECLHAGGAIPGTFLNVDLNHPNASPTIVSDSGSLTPLQMPNAVINIAPGHTEYIALNPRGGKGSFYAWSVRLNVVVDQESETYSFGSPRSPLHSWFGPLPSAAYDYDFGSHSWQK